jgi:DNA-binding Xre family transcriptional regulator
VRSENLCRLCAFFGCRIEDLVEYVPDAVKEKKAAARRRKA